jgi:hypothetical protein
MEAIAVSERQISIYASISGFASLEHLVVSRCHPVLAPS